MVTLGDILEIPLTDGRKAFGRYVDEVPTLGPLLQVFDLITDEPIEVAHLLEAGLLFPPVLAAFPAAVERGEWKVIGSLPVDGSSRPKFVSARYNEKTGRPAMWFLWDGEDGVPLGEVLPEQHRGLEYRVVWSPADIVERIETGKVPFPYGDLVRDNAFVPRVEEKPAKRNWFAWKKKSV
jgi:hypothetical protein